MSGGVSFLVLMFWCSVSFLHLDDPLFLKVEDVFSFYFFNRLSVPLGCISSPFSIPMSHRFFSFHCALDILDVPFIFS
jgi:hypothetical protein